MLNGRITLKPMIKDSAPLIALFSAALIASFFANEGLFHLLNQLAPYRPLFWLHLTHVGDVLIATVFFSAFAVTHPKLLWSLAISILLTVFIVQGLKHAVNAPRPPEILPVDQIHVIVPASLPVDEVDLGIDYVHLVDSRPDTAAAWENIRSDPGSREARYWVPRMGGVVTKNRFGIALAKETSDLEQGTYRGIYRPSSRSFPSGHTATIVCAVALMMLYLRKKKWTWVLSLVGVVVAGTRIVVGVHWPLDVAVGGLIGWAVAILVTWAAQNTSIASTRGGHRVIVFLPGVASLALLTRDPVYPEIAMFETVVGTVGLLLTLFGCWQIYRKN